MRGDLVGSCHGGAGLAGDTTQEDRMSTVQRVAQIFGVVFLIVGILGFVMTGTTMEASMESSPALLGLFHVNLLHNVVHTLFGAWGLVAARSFAGAKRYAQIGGAVYIILAILGVVAPTTFGLIPVGGNDVWLHALIGVVLTGAGFSARETAPSATAA
jgi:protein-S-isoprenylcysteine O-methyltransferase Ste14